MWSSGLCRFESRNISVSEGPRVSDGRLLPGNLWWSGLLQAAPGHCHWSETARSSWTAKKEGNMMLRAFRCKSVSACASHTALSSSVGASFASVLVMPPHHATNCTAIFRSSRACIGDLRDRRHRADLASQPVVTNPSLIRASI